MGSGECSTDSLNEPCECGHQRRRHLEPPGGQCVACSSEGNNWRHDFKPQGSGPVATPQNADHRCRCGHVKYAHEKSEGRCGVGSNGPSRCGCQAYVCDHSRCGWKPREECTHPNKVHTGSLYDGPGGRKNWLYYTCPDCKGQWREQEPEQCQHPDKHATGARYSAVDGVIWYRCPDCKATWSEPWEKPDEPPLTPEEEEQAPEDEGCLGVYCDQEEPCRCWPPKAPEGEDFCEIPHATIEEEEACERERVARMKLPPPEGPEYTPCVCGHIEPEHNEDRLQRHCLKCECVAYRTEPDFELPPQPERRPPYLVGYSVAGHLYEVALSGDATVQAVDGALVIKHSLGFVAGITHVAPLVNDPQKES